MDSGGVTDIRLPYHHLRNAEMELVELNGSPRARSSGESPPKQPGGDRADSGTSNSSTRKLVLACMVAAGVQFGWALQLSLLTPYIQERLGWVVGSAHLGASGDVFFLPFLFSVTPPHTECR